MAGFPFVNQSAPTGVAVSPDAATLYAALSTGARPYAINSDGGLAAGSTVAAGIGPSAIAISPSGSHLYVANSGSDSVSGYSIASDTTLSSATATANGAGTAPDGIAMTPDGRFLFVANAGTGTISGYSVDAVTGALSPLPGSPYGAGASTSAPAGLTMAPSGAYLYAALKGGDAIAGFAIDGATGALTALDGSPYADGAPGSAPSGVAVAPDGARLLVANSGDGTVGRYLLSAGVPVARVDQAPVVPGALSVAISPDGDHAYVGGGATVAAFDFSSLAVLTPRGTPQSTTTATHGALAITPNQGPMARMNPVAAPATTPSRFQGGPSPDSDGSIANWSWDFGDGTTGQGDTVTHTYATPGTYNVTLTVTDNEGCSTTPIYTGQQMSCVPSGFGVWTEQVNIPPAPDNTVPDQACAHDGDDGFCGTPDRKAPLVTVLGFNDGASITTVDAPDSLVGTITPDPSGVSKVLMRFTKSAGTAVKTVAKKTVVKRVCHKVRGKRRCKRKKVVKKTNVKVPACLTVSGTKNYLVRYLCSKVPWVTLPAADGTFRYELPIALGIGSYTVDAVAVDGAGNQDVLESGRNHMTFKIIATPSNSGGSDTGAGGTGTTTTTTPPVTDTGSPFGH